MTIGQGRLMRHFFGYFGLQWGVKPGGVGKVVGEFPKTEGYSDFQFKGWGQYWARVGVDVD